MLLYFSIFLNFLRKKISHLETFLTIKNKSKQLLTKHFIFYLVFKKNKNWKKKNFKRNMIVWYNFFFFWNLIYLRKNPEFVSSKWNIKKWFIKVLSIINFGTLISNQILVEFLIKIIGPSFNYIFRLSTINSLSFSFIKH